MSQTAHRPVLIVIAGPKTLGRKFILRSQGVRELGSVVVNATEIMSTDFRDSRDRGASATSGVKSPIGPLSP